MLWKLITTAQYLRICSPLATHESIPLRIEETLSHPGGAAWPLKLEGFLGVEVRTASGRLIGEQIDFSELPLTAVELL